MSLPSRVVVIFKMISYFTQIIRRRTLNISFVTELSDYSFPLLLNRFVTIGSCVESILNFQNDTSVMRLSSRQLVLFITDL